MAWRHHETTRGVDDELLQQVGDILGARSMPETVDRSLEEVVAAERRRRTIDPLASGDGTDVGDESVTTRAWCRRRGSSWTRANGLEEIDLDQGTFRVVESLLAEKGPTSADPGPRDRRRGRTQPLTVLHCDRDIEIISGVTGQPHRWVVEPGSL